MDVLQDVALRVWGDYACFTRPENKVERMSYNVMTPSAARAVLEAILWKPAMRWEVKKIDVIKPIRWASVRRNEVGAVVSTSKVMTAMNRGYGNLGLNIEEERQQRAALILRDVEYVIHARFELTERAGERDNLEKIEDMFTKRARKGRCFTQPYLGCREFSANFELCEEPIEPIDKNKDLGWMLHDMDYSQPSAPKARFFHAIMEKGSVLCDVNQVDITA